MNFLEKVTALLGRTAPGRSPAMLLNLLAPWQGYRVTRDIAYGQNPRHRLDLYRPENLPATTPVLLFFYGGGFVAGRKSEYRMVGEALASLGLLVAIADYRIYPEVRFPDFLHDGAHALRHLHAIAAAHGGDPSRLFVGGHSAGAYISVMLAVNPAYLRDAGVERNAIRGVIGIAGAYDFLPIQGERRIAVFGGDNRVETQPIHFVCEKKPPMLLATGAKDATVLARNTHSLAARLRSRGSEVEEKLYPGVGHMGIILSLARGFRRIAPLREDIAHFIINHSRA